jgi:hypothetical protein
VTQSASDSYRPVALRGPGDARTSYAGLSLSGASRLRHWRPLVGMEVGMPARTGSSVLSCVGDGRPGAGTRRSDGGSG